MNLNLKKLEEDVVLAKSELKAREEMAKLKLVEIEKELKE